jgi:hypothetical protein
MIGRYGTNLALVSRMSNHLVSKVNNVFRDPFFIVDLTALVWWYFTQCESGDDTFPSDQDVIE